MPRSEVADARRIAVVVVRSGGLAGLRKTWEAEPPAAAAPRWESLLEACPWDEPPAPTRGADRFEWSMTAHCGETEREARMGDAALVGPWRDLVDAVREFADAGSGSARARAVRRDPR